MSQTLAQKDVQVLTEADAYQIGLEAYMFCYPLVTMHITYSQCTNLEPGKKPGFGPANAFSHIRAYPDANFKAVVRPNFDTLYSSAWLDLSNEPIVLSIPDSNNRYYLMPMLDMWSDVFASPGWRTSGTGAQEWAIVPPNWSGKLPDGVARINAPTPLVWLIGRTKTDGPSDFDAVHKFQDGLSLTPLSQYKNSTATAVKQKIDSSIDMTTPPLDQVNGMSAAAYFGLASELMQKHAPHITDWSMLARMKRIGLEPNQKFDLSKLDAKNQQAVEKGAADALKLMVSKLQTLGRPVNGWNMNTDSMGVYGNFYIKRAIVAMVGLGANQPEDAVYPLNIVDSDGNPLNGENKYVLHFEKADLPPVYAFWSVTMYDKDGFQAANSLNRFAISSWMNLTYNADGSLDLYLQNENPGAEKEANWLPAPKTQLGVTMRLYAPKDVALNGYWNPPAIRKVK
ncbi:MAG: DUF1254 domain-containing protein [Cyanobacteria bacterium SZAS-4]|nr:DUF1254 domain-containing protein [Cyanobacteria bacterium SZAS-4]